MRFVGSTKNSLSVSRYCKRHTDVSTRFPEGCTKCPSKGDFLRWN